MKRNRWYLNLLAATLAATWALAGCDNASDPDPSGDVAGREQTVDLDDPYGGYNTADEAPAFDDAMLAADYGPESDAAFVDDVDTTHTDRRHPRRFLMITWGNLRADSLIDFSTDWTGGLCAENGVVRVVRTIRFEPRDHLLPRTSRECVEWVSHTQPHFDGVIVALYRTDCDTLRHVTRPDTLCQKPLSVTFKTGPLTVTFSQDELADLHRVIPVDEAGNAVAFNVVTRVPGECANGFLAGQWKPVPATDAARGVRGHFRGKWVSENGLHMGYLRGVYGINARHQNVFFGKWIAETGRFRGLLAGRYGTFAETATRADGWFEGVWFSRQLHTMGGLRGVWGTSDAEGRDGGFFRGEWRQRCATAP